MQIPAVGKARGIFEIFVPGLFVFLHLVPLLIGLILLENQTVRLSAVGKLITENSAAFVTTSLGFGYLFGVMLRVLRCQHADSLSGFFRRNLKRITHLRKLVRRELKFAPFEKEKFPYFGHIKNKCEHDLPKETLEFFNKTWGNHNKNYQGTTSNPGREFFNFCKGIIATIDPISNIEIQAQEALSRYIAQMLYALVTVILVLVAIVGFGLSPFARYYHAIYLLIAVYSFSVLVILMQYRLVRCKESTALFIACFANRDVFEDLSKSPRRPRNGDEI